MDFINGLPKSMGNKLILVAVDRLSKYAHFKALTHPFAIVQVAQAYFGKFLSYIDELRALSLTTIQCFLEHLGKPYSLYVLLSSCYLLLTTLKLMNRQK